MNAAHAHLLVNHLPIIGAMLAVPLLGLAALMRKQRGLVLAAAVVLTIGAVGGGLSLASGDAAADVVEGLPGVSEADIEAHEERAGVAIGFAVVAALASLIAAGLELDRGVPAPRPAVLGVLVLALVNAGAMAWTGASGGVIRHTEIRAGAQTDVPADAAASEDGGGRGRGRGRGSARDDD